jgi:hypothetical protein
VPIYLERGDQLRAIFIISPDRFGNRDLKMWLLTQDNYRRYRQGQRYYFIKGAGGSYHKKGRIFFTARRSGRYYLQVANFNRSGTKRYFRLVLYSVKPRLTPEFIRERNFYDKMYRGYLALFKINHFDIKVRVCGTKNAWSDRDSNITFCRELINELKKKGHSEAIKFILHHEFAHSLMRRLGWPIYSNEEVADEFATVMSLMFRQYKAPIAAARYWHRKKVTARYIKSKLSRFDRHTITPQRARNIVYWVRQRDKLLKRWQNFLVPKMTDGALRVLQRGWEKGTINWVNIDVVRAELGRRTQLRR